MLGNADVLKEGETHSHPLFHQSTEFMQVARAIYQAETYQMRLRIVHVDVLRADVADMFCNSDRTDLERSASKFCQNILLTDRNRTSTSLLRPVLGNITDRRFAIEVAAPRQSLWFWPGQLLGDDSRRRAPAGRQGGGRGPLD